MKGKVYDYLILGAGAAGLQLGYEAMQAGHSYLILEKEAPGAFFSTFPRHRTLLSINKIHTGYDDSEINLRWDWNSLLCDSDEMLFKNYSKRYLPSADDLVRYFQDFAKHYKLNIQTGVNVVHITRDKEHFALTSSDGERFRSTRLIIASGVSKQNIPPVPGVELCEMYADISVDPEDYSGQRVLVIGKGNSAFEVADSLIETTTFIHVISPEPLRLAWASRFVGDLRAVNNNFLDTYQLKCQNAVLNGIVTNIAKKDETFEVSVSYTLASGEKETLIYDRIIVAAGFRFDAEIFDEPCQPRMVVNNRYPELTPHFEAVNVPGMFFAGTITQAIDYKRSTSSFIHGFRYTARALMRYLNKTYHGIAWKHQVLAAESKSLVNAVLARVNRTSALWQQFGFLCDVIEIGTSGGKTTYTEEVPVIHALSGNFLADNDAHCFLITLNFGSPPDKPFAIDRKPEPSHAHESSFLHPIICHYHKGELMAEIHILEDLHAEWNKQVHIQPLTEFFTEILAKLEALD